MAIGKKKNDIILHGLVRLAQQKNIEVRTEKLLREVGYHARSGRCRFKGKDIIILDRDEPLSEQINFLVEQLATEEFEPTYVPAHLRKLLSVSA
jgi:hypothetical protein